MKTKCKRSKQPSQCIQIEPTCGEENIPGSVAKANSQAERAGKTLLGKWIILEKKSPKLSPLAERLFLTGCAKWR
jgi:hypothetical protein